MQKYFVSSSHTNIRLILKTTNTVNVFVLKKVLQVCAKFISGWTLFSGFIGIVFTIQFRQIFTMDCQSSWNTECKCKIVFSPLGNISKEPDKSLETSSTEPLLTEDKYRPTHSDLPAQHNKSWSKNNSFYQFHFSSGSGSTEELTSIIKQLQTHRCPGLPVCLLTVQSFFQIFS